MPCHAWKCIPTVISNGVNISEVTGCHLLWQISFQWDSSKLLQRLVSLELTTYLSVLDLFLTQWIMVILTKGHKPDNFESHNSLKLIFINIQGLFSNFVECKTFLESNIPDILDLCDTSLDETIDSCNFSLRGYFPLIQTDCITHIHGLAVYLKGRLLLFRSYLWKTVWMLTYVFNWLYFSLWRL